MQSQFKRQTRNLKIKLAFDKFKDNLITVYPKEPLYNYNELCTWFNNYWEPRLNKYMEDNEINVKSKINLYDRYVDLYDENGKRIMRLALNIITGLRELNKKQYNYDNARSFIFDKKRG